MWDKDVSLDISGVFVLSSIGDHGIISKSVCSSRFSFTAVAVWRRAQIAKQVTSSSGFLEQVHVHSATSKCSSCPMSSRMQPLYSWIECSIACQPSHPGSSPEVNSFWIMPLGNLDAMRNFLPPCSINWQAVLFLVGPRLQPAELWGRCCHGNRIEL